MKCPQCIKENKKSIVTEGSSIYNAVYYPNMYDEDGILIPKVSNKITTNYSCSNGHTWSQ